MKNIRKTKIIFFVLPILAIGAAAVFGYFNVKRPEGNKGLAPIISGPPPLETISEKEQKSIDLSQKFTHPSYRFSFSYPAGFTVSRLPSPDVGETVLVQDTDRKAGFQIHVEPYNDPDIEITAERLRRDIPEMIIKEPQDVFIGTGGKTGRGLAFIVPDTRTRDVWFIFRGALYQITALMEDGALLERVLGTWSFQ